MWSSLLSTCIFWQMRHYMLHTLCAYTWYMHQLYYLNWIINFNSVCTSSTKLVKCIHYCTRLLRFFSLYHNKSIGNSFNINWCLSRYIITMTKPIIIIIFIIIQVALSPLQEVAWCTILNSVYKYSLLYQTLEFLFTLYTLANLYNYRQQFQCWCLSRYI